MSAVEVQFPNPPAGQPQWLTLAINTFNTMVPRWDMEKCNGGLRWQVFEKNAGWDYKNSISNGAFFQLAARLARYTGDANYVTWAEKIWNWCENVGLISKDYAVYDGTDRNNNCSDVNHLEWSYNNAIFIYGAAALANMTQSKVWIDRTNGLLAASSRFFSPFPNSTNIMFEAACETVSTCNVDQFSFKAYLARWLAKTAIIAPWTKDTIYALLEPSAIAATSSCVQSGTEVSCGSHWYTGGFDGISGLGQQLSALEVVSSLLAFKGGEPVTAAGVKVPCFQQSGDASVANRNCAVAAGNSAGPADDSAADAGPQPTTLVTSTVPAATLAPPTQKAPQPQSPPATGNTQSSTMPPELQRILDVIVQWMASLARNK